VGGYLEHRKNEKKKELRVFFESSWVEGSRELEQRGKANRCKVNNSERDAEPKAGKAMKGL